jgi:hypothetical protein
MVHLDVLALIGKILIFLEPLLLKVGTESTPDHPKNLSTKSFFANIDV